MSWKRERSRSTGAHFPKSGKSCGQCCVEGVWHSCLHWEGVLNTKVCHHYAAVEDVGMTTLGKGAKKIH